jgi:phosphohistidine phosphatase
MRRLMLLRHAKAERPVGVRDLERTLDARGQEDAPRIGAYMASHGLKPDKVIVSTSARTQQTWDLASGAFDKPPPVTFDERVYENETEILFDLVGTTEPEVQSLLLVGHSPSVHELAEFLIGTGDLDGRRLLHEKFPTAALVVIDFDAVAWDGVKASSGRFERFVTPKSFPDASE